MSHHSDDRLLNRTVLVLAGVILILACTGQAWGQEAPAGGKDPLNTRVFRSCFGIMMHFWQNQPLEEIAMVEDIGATWIRGEGNWSGEDADPAVYSTRKLERWVNEAHRRGLKVMVHLGSTHEGLRRPDDYAKYAGLVAKKLRGKVQAYHGPNEPYGPFLETFSPELQHQMAMWTVEGESQWRGWIEKHSELVRKAADAIHEADPQAIMLPEGVDVWRHPSDVFFTHHRWMFEAGLGDNVSGMTGHPYTGKDIEGVGFVRAMPPEITAMGQPAGAKKDYPYFDEQGRVSLGDVMQTLRDEAKKATGRDFEIWLNEWSYLPGWVGGNQEIRGAYLVRMFMVGFANNARIIVWHNMRDMRDGPYGLVDNQMNKRPPYFAYRTMSRTIGDMYLLKYVHGSPTATKGVQAYLFGKDDQKVLVVWNIDNTQRNAKVDGIRPGARIVDTFGKEAGADSVGGVVSLVVDGKPQYIVGVADDVSVTDQTKSVAVEPARKRPARTKLGPPVEIPAPVMGSTLTVGRKTGRSSIKAANESLIIDSEGLGFVGLNFYDDGDVSLASGGGNVGVGTAKPASTLEVTRSQFEFRTF